MKIITKIEKEDLINLPFTKEEVLLNPEDRKMRMADLNRSQTLGNLLQTKVKIIFESKDRGSFEVHTTVWAVGSNFISLKGGTTIPIHAIHKVD